MIGSILNFSTYANCLSNINKSGFGFFVDTIKMIWSMFAILGLLISFFRGNIVSITATFFSSSVISISTLSPTKGVISSFLNFPLANASYIFVSVFILYVFDMFPIIIPCIFPSFLIYIYQIFCFFSRF